MTTPSLDLTAKHCKACEGGQPPLDIAQISAYLAELPGWELQGKAIGKRFEFKNFYQTIAFVNAAAWIANREDHHPDLEVSYRVCQVRYTTHAVGGLSENDFICAAKIEALFGN